MWKKLGYAALTYYSPFRLVVTGIGIALILMTSLTLDPDASQNSFASSLLPLLMPSLVFGTLATMQAQYQFANPQARLVPGYAFPHLACLGGLLVAAVLVTAAVAHHAGLNVLGATAFAMASWFLLTPLNKFGGLLLPVAFVILISMRGGFAEFWLVPHNGYEIYHWALIGVGAIGIYVWMHHLLHTEVDPETMRNAYYLASDRPSHLAREARRSMEVAVVERGWKAWLSDWWHERIPKLHHASNSVAHLSRFLRYGNGPLPTLVLAFALPFTALLYVVGFQVAISLAEDAPFPFEASDFASFAVYFGLLAPAGSAVLLVANRQARMGSELLLPISRRTYIDSLLLSAACEAAIWWLTIQFIAFTLAWYDPDLEMTAALVCAYLSLATSFLIFLIGSGWLIAICQSKVIRVAGLILISLVPVIVLVLWWEDRRRNGDLLYIFCGLIAGAVGALCIQAARHGWRDVEVR